MYLQAHTYEGISLNTYEPEILSQIGVPSSRHEINNKLILIYYRSQTEVWVLYFDAIGVGKLENKKRIYYTTGQLHQILKDVGE